MEQMVSWSCSRLSDALKSGGKFEGKAINYKKDGTPFIMY